MSPIRVFLYFYLLSLAQQTVLAKESVVPRLVVIGDSTVKNGRGNGEGSLWGWGDVLAKHFDTQRIVIENHARGGRSSRTFLTEGLWDGSLRTLRKGDFLLMQFGHNDGGKMFKGDRPRASIKGNGEDVVTGVIEKTSQQETVHTYGWYLRKFIADAKAKGATPIVLSLVPRNRWNDNRVLRSNHDYGKWAAEAAIGGNAAFIDLNEIIATRYEEIGQDLVSKALFTENDWTHTTKKGAEINAACVVEGICRLDNCSLKNFLISQSAMEDDVRPLWQFDFGDLAVADGFQRVLTTTQYSEQMGFGFEPKTVVESIEQDSSDPAMSDALVGRSPFHFSVALAEGNYRVKVVGGSQPLTVKAELRRLMMQDKEPTSGNLVHGEFTVNIRRPDITNSESVHLKSRELEREWWAWDEKMTLEFNGPQPCISSLIIEPEPSAITVFLAGDSTVTDQPLEPWSSWGQMLPCFFKPGVAVANHAQSGESIHSSLAAKRFKKIFSLMKAGDYLFIQFGHNDMKDKSSDALSTYRENLIKLVKQTRSLGGTPVLVTSMERKSGRRQATLGEYPQTVRGVAAQHNVPLIDLNKLSIQLYQTLGDDIDLAFQDGTHHNNYGSYLLAKCVIQSISDIQLPLAELIRDDISVFNPNDLNDLDCGRILQSPRSSLSKPDGS